jgi:hypothetical protein
MLEPDRSPAEIAVEAARAFALKTWHGTYAAYDERSKTLRHVSLAEMNRQVVHLTQLFLEPVGNRARIRLGSPNMPRSLWRTAANTFEVVYLDGVEMWLDIVAVTEPEYFALRHTDSFACAEESGEITISRGLAQQWESFTLI